MAVMHIFSFISVKLTAGRRRTVVFCFSIFHRSRVLFEDQQIPRAFTQVGNAPRGLSQPPRWSSGRTWEKLFTPIEGTLKCTPFPPGGRGSDDQKCMHGNTLLLTGKIPENITTPTATSIDDPEPPAETTASQTICTPSDGMEVGTGTLG